MYMLCDEVRGGKKNHFTLIITGNRNLNEKLGVCTAFESSARKGIIQLFFFFFWELEQSNLIWLAWEYLLS